MWLKIAVPGVIALIFAFVFFDVTVLSSRITGFKPFGEKQEEIKKNPTPSTPTSATASATLASATPSSKLISPSQAPSNKPTPKPSLKAITGSLTVLKNNTTSSSNSYVNNKATISGTIDLSGTILSNTSIVIAAKKSGSTDSYQVVVSGISASDNATWSWGSAESGVSYDLIAILKGSSNGVNIDYAKSQIYVVNAPSSNQIFAINAGFSMNAPTNTITTTCSTYNNNNTWQATVNFPSVSGAQAYWLQIGTTSGASDFQNVKQNAATGDNQTISVTLTDSVIYYAQYAVASVVNPETAQYSAFSSTQSIKCP